MFKFEVPSGYIALVQSVILAVYVAFFGSRGYEKVQSIKKGNDSKSWV